jgi:hypothetical protein
MTAALREEGISRKAPRAVGSTGLTVDRLARSEGRPSGGVLRRRSDARGAESGEAAEAGPVVDPPEVAAAKAHHLVAARERRDADQLACWRLAHED